jgi:hypothetical protein
MVASKAKKMAGWRRRRWWRHEEAADGGGGENEGTETLVVTSRWHLTSARAPLSPARTYLHMLPPPACDAAHHASACCLPAPHLRCRTAVVACAPRVAHCACCAIIAALEVALVARGVSLGAHRAPAAASWRGAYRRAAAAGEKWAGGRSVSEKRNILSRIKSGIGSGWRRRHLIKQAL